MKKKIKIFIHSTFLFLQVFVIVFAQTQITIAADLSSGSDIFSLFKPNELTAEGNVAMRKLPFPTMNVIFDKNVYYEGEIASAQAIARNFIDDDLYYTWFLKREDCDLDEDPDKEKRDKCDLDDDDKITENDWKIEAAKIIVRGSFDPFDADYDTDFSDSDGFEAKPMWNGEGNGDNCYIQDFDSGLIYELQSVEEKFSCDNPVCVQDKTLECGVENKQACQQTTTPSCEISDAENFEATVSCSTGTAYCGISSFSNNLSDGEMCSLLGSSLGQTCESFGADIPTCNFVKKDEGNQCKNLFPSLPKDLDAISGDGKFKIEEEEFWGTDPMQTSTASNGNLDEENVIGKNINKFSWKYKKGDEVGVVVQGYSALPGKHLNNKNMIMWAFSNNKCSIIDDNDTKKRYYEEKVYNSSTGILTIENIDINDCFEENLIDPVRGDENGNGMINLSLKVIPGVLKNDLLQMERGGEIVVKSLMDGVLNEEEFIYRWSVEVSGDGTESPSFWKDVSNKIAAKTYLEGIGNSQLKFTLNLSEDDIPSIINESFYIRINVEAYDSINNEKAVIGKTRKVIKVKNIEKDIIPYNVDISEDKLNLAGEICNNQDEQGKNCEVLNGEIIGLSIPDNDREYKFFSWMVNGDKISCDSSISDLCEDGNYQGNTTFIPIIGNVGDKFTVRVQAKESLTSIGKSFEKTFEIVRPTINIVSLDREKAWPRVLGEILNDEGEYVSDESSVVIEALQGSKITLKAESFPSWIMEEAEFKWSIGGKIIETSSQEIEIDVDNIPINIMINGSYIINKDVSRMIASKWNKSLFVGNQHKFSDSVQIQPMDGDLYAASSDNQYGFLASAFNNIPQYFGFILKIFAAAGLILGVTGVTFSLLGKNSHL